MYPIFIALHPIFIALMWVFIVLAMGSYFLFRDTMNKIQYLETVRLYWITRDNAEVDTPRVMRAIMKHTAPPYWYGRGIQFRFRRWTFQVGILTGKAESLDKQLGRGWLDVDTRTIRRASHTSFADQEGLDSGVQEEA